MAVFIKNPSMGIYYMDFTMYGVRVQKSCRTKYKKEATRKEVEAKQALGITIGITPSPFSESDSSSEIGDDKPSPTFNEAIERGFQERWAYIKDGEGTKRRLQAVSDILKNPKVTDITSSMVSGLRVALRKRKMAPATINRHLAHLKTLLTMASLDWELNVQQFRIRLEKEPEGRQRVITKDEMGKVLAYLRRPKPDNRARIDDDLADLTEVVIGSGMRLGEVTAITYAKHIDLEAGLIRLSGDITKSSKSRTIPLTRRALEILVARKRLNPRKPFRHPSTSYTQCWARMRHAIGLGRDKEFLIHSLRHTYGSTLSQIGVPIRHVQMLLGHSTLKMTERYTHAALDDLKRGVAVLDGVEGPLVDHCDGQVEADEQTRGGIRGDGSPSTGLQTSGLPA